MKRTARHGWWARLLGLWAELRSTTRRYPGPFPPPPPIPEALLDAEVQLEGQGFGRLFGRHYVADFHSALSPAELMRRVKPNFARLGPEELAAFEKSKGSPWSLRPGDEFDINILGPFNGRVRVIHSDETSFAFVTLKGHPEAGRIRFSVARLGPGALRFQVVSWARSRDALVDLAYDKIPLAKSLQAATWRTLIERTAALAEGRLLGRVRVSEAKLEGDPP